MAAEKPYQPVRPDVSLPAEEERILAYWDEHKVFERSLEKGDRFYSFYDGPPFATGLPHYGHLLQSIQKDVVPRYWTMKGCRIPRRWGWDCHGVPVEFEINKAHGIKSRKDVLAVGIGQYNDWCRAIVQRCANDWKRTIRRLGRWVDMENAYFTSSPEFMESVWWVFKSLFDQGLIYEGYKVVPYSTGISTALSNFEAGQNYKDVQDPAITLTFPVRGEPGLAFLAWTTTPWTLPANLALAVHPELRYARVREKATGARYWLAEDSLAFVWPMVGGKHADPAAARAESRSESNDARATRPIPDEGARATRAIAGAGAGRAIPDAIDVEEVLPGAKLLGLEYEPLFPFFADWRARGAFRVIAGEHVTTDATGIVHTAPGHGEEDYYSCLKAGIPVACPVDDDGCYTHEVPGYAGRPVKDCDKDIIAELKARGRVLKHETITHAYPFCPRTDTPLINRAVTSWFVAVEKLRPKLLAANRETRWVPEGLRDGRFGNWLENARDWAISRNRFWGTPLPVWKNAEGEVVCVGSRAELEKLSGRRLEDLHLEHALTIEIPSPTGKSPLRHVGTVLDCWFESGSMPYAQWGYPFANREGFEHSFPAEFIGEALDQTRGWFYTLTVLGAALFGKSPFRNVIVTGMILAEDGRKMSKSLKNYPDPNDVLARHGADAVRLYIIDSPLFRGQEIRFSENGVRDVVRKILLRWWNSYSFFVSYANVDGFIPRGDASRSPNLLDQWLLSRIQTLAENTEREMAAYRLYNVVPALLSFIEELTNTYIRFNRPHFWKEGMPEDKRLAYETLYEALVSLAKLMAPFAPFMAESTFLNLTRAARESVHLEDYPLARSELRRPELEGAVRVMEALVLLGRNYRERIGVKAKIPLKRLVVLHRDASVLANLRRFEPYFREELNFREFEYSTDETAHVQVACKANFPVLGKRLGAKMKTIAAGIAKLGMDEIERLERGEPLLIENEEIRLADVEVRRGARGENPNVATHALVSFLADSTVTHEQIREGLAREVVRKVQAARKNADLALDDRICLALECDGAIREAVEAHRERVMGETLARDLRFGSGAGARHQETVELDEGSLGIAIEGVERTV